MAQLHSEQPFKALAQQMSQCHHAQSLIIMSKPAGHPDVDIPAVFVSQKAGIIMHRLITPGESIAVIIPVRAQH